jgi:exodeoxyribonuclease VII small subunit
MAKPAASPPSPAAGDEIPADISAMSFEQALAALEEIVRRLETGQVDLEESIAIYARGTQLKRHCEAKLRAAEARIEKIVVGPGGSVGLAPADID